jgi:two-component system nitrate/nitrite response regulator NarL
VTQATASSPPVASLRPLEEMHVLIVDDHVLFAEAIQMALRDQGMMNVAIVTDPTAVPPIVADPAERPDVVLMDLGLPGESGLALGARIVRECPQVKVLAVTALSDHRLLREAMRVGFSGFLTKDTQVSRLMSSIRTVGEGEVVIPRKLARDVGATTGGGHTGQPAMDEEASLLASQLTEREHEVLQLLAEGATSGQIADRLGISRNTVRTHVQSVLGKLGVHSRLEAAAFAVRNGLVKPKHP